MRKGGLVLSCLIAGTYGGHSDVQAARLPAPVESGLRAYRSEGKDAAVRAFLANSPLEREAALRSNTIQTLAAIETSYGSFAGHETLEQAAIGSRALRSYVILLYQKGPVYAHFDSYRGSGGWVVTSFLFNTKPEMILPPRLLGG